MDEIAGLPRMELGFPGPLRDRLVAAVLDGSKTATTSIALEYEIEQEPIPQPGTRQLVIDSAGIAVAVVETTDVREVRLGAVSWAHARDEGEGFSSVLEWRTAHERFWHSAEMREAVGDPTFAVDDDTLVVLERFRLISML
jgi:uncharacterized protein YhfF